MKRFFLSLLSTYVMSVKSDECALCFFFFFFFFCKTSKSEDKFQESFFFLCLFILIYSTSIIMQRNYKNCRTLFMPLVSLLLCAHIRVLFIMYFFLFRVCVMQFGLSSLSFFRYSILFFFLCLFEHAHILPSSFFPNRLLFLFSMHRK